MTDRLDIEFGEDFCNFVLGVLGHVRGRIKLVEESVSLDVHLVEDQTVLLVLVGLEAGWLVVVLVDVLIIFFTFHNIDLLRLLWVQIGLVGLHLNGHLVALRLIAECLTLIWHSLEAWNGLGLHQLLGNGETWDVSVLLGDHLVNLRLKGVRLCLVLTRLVGF